MRGGMSMGARGGEVVPALPAYVDRSLAARFYRFMAGISLEPVRQQMIAKKREWFEVRETVLVPPAPRGRVVEHPGAGVIEIGSRWQASLGMAVIRKGAETREG